MAFQTLRMEVPQSREVERWLSMDNLKMKKSMWYMAEILLDGAVRCASKGYQVVEDRYVNQLIGFVFAMSSAGLIDGIEFKALTRLVTYREYDRARRAFKANLLGE